METETAAVLDRDALRGARRLGAWGAGALVKQEGVWRTRDDRFITAERGADGEIAYREVTAELAADALRAHGHPWRAGRLLAPADDAAGAEAAAGDTDAAQDVAVTATAPAAETEADAG